MKKFLILFTVSAILSSCATLFCGSRAKVTLTSNDISEPVNITADGRSHRNVYLPTNIRVKRGYKPSHIDIEADGYEPQSIVVDKCFNPISILNVTNLLAWGIDAATGAITKPYENTYNVSMKRILKDLPNIQTPYNYVEDPTIIAGEAQNRVSRDNAGRTALERTIIRWFFDSDPQGARIFYRVISSIPSEVKNTNET